MYPGGGGVPKEECSRSLGIPRKPKAVQDEPRASPRPGKGKAKPKARHIETGTLRASGPVADIR